MDDRDHKPRTSLKRLKETCRKGHKFTPENTQYTRRGARFCRECDESRKKLFREKKKDACSNNVEVACPVCGIMREVTYLTSERLRRFPHACRSCSRKEVRGRMAFAPRDCAKCGKRFAAHSGATRFCGECVKRTEPVPRPCPVCGKRFIGYKSRKTCSPPCARRVRINQSYFDGKMFEAIGWPTKTCQLCGKTGIKKGASVHHVFGHPNHDMLVVLCPGCHNCVTQLAGRSALTPLMMERLQWFALAQRYGQHPPGLTAPNEIVPTVAK